MKNVRIQFNRRGRGPCVAALCLAASCAWGGIAAPLYLGNLVPVRDESGRPMQGSYLPANAANRSLVEIRLAVDGLIRPPDTNGGAHPLNPPLATNSVCGVGLNASTANSGLFCLAFPLRPPAGTRIFARVYNAPTVAEASFYADSQVVMALALGVSLVLSFDPALPLDSGDDDGDGLANSWEQVLGTSDRPVSDYDGDGMSDLFEMLAGTDPTDPASLLAFLVARPESGAVLPEGIDPAATRMHLRWQTVPGKRYQLESAFALAPDSATGEVPVFAPLREVMTAADGEYALDAWIDISGSDDKGIFRVRLAETGF